VRYKSQNGWRLEILRFWATIRRAQRTQNSKVLGGSSLCHTLVYDLRHRLHWALDQTKKLLIWTISGLHSSCLSLLDVKSFSAWREVLWQNERSFAGALNILFFSEQAGSSELIYRWSAECSCLPTMDILWLALDAHSQSHIVLQPTSSYNKPQPPMLSNSEQDFLISIPLCLRASYSSH